MNPILFIDRDGTICYEPDDFQVDRIDKIRLRESVIPSLLRLQQAGFTLVMISNQDGLGTKSFPQEDFDRPHQFLMDLLETQGIRFSDILICPHLPEDHCFCRKPNLGLVTPYLQRTDWDRSRSAVIGDRESDIVLADRMGLRSFQIGAQENQQDIDWPFITEQLLEAPRKAEISRLTNETKIQVNVNLDQKSPIDISTGLGFFDHMLEQLAKHGGFSLVLNCKGDTHIDDHHSVEDVGLALGQALNEALGNKRGIQRYGFLLPMDESQCQVSLDLSGRPYFVFDGEFHRAQVGELATEMIPHFFRSLSETLKANLHIHVRGDNDHHQAEAMFKAVARALGQAIQKTGDNSLPSTKGLL